jgi:hypothetical protein
MNFVKTLKEKNNELVTIANKYANTYLLTLYEDKKEDYFPPQILTFDPNIPRVFTNSVKAELKQLKEKLDSYDDYYVKLSVKISIARDEIQDYYNVQTQLFLVMTVLQELKSLSVNDQDEVMTLLTTLLSMPFLR